MTESVPGNNKIIPAKIEASVLYSTVFFAFYFYWDGFHV